MDAGPRRNDAHVVEVPTLRRTAGITDGIYIAGSTCDVESVR